eukprot:1138986-Pelagomonas_calceolata.AAC.5
MPKHLNPVRSEAPFYSKNSYLVAEHLLPAKWLPARSNCLFSSRCLQSNLHNQEYAWDGRLLVRTLLELLKRAADALMIPVGIATHSASMGVRATMDRQLCHLTKWAGRIPMDRQYPHTFMGRQDPQLDNEGPPHP